MTTAEATLQHIADLCASAQEQLQQHSYADLVDLLTRVERLASNVLYPDERSEAE